MGKNDFLSPKAIANRIKSKGLQKLRWYCQMCQKQCRDENGFKCHLTSEGHQRQMLLFGQRPQRIIDGYSEEFEKTFLHHFRTAHRTTRMQATVLYNEFIADRNHVHMNSTKWLTLTEFVKYLGKTGKCKVEETPKGWFVTLTQKDPEEMMHLRLKEKKRKKEEADEIRHERELQAQVERAAKQAKAEDAGEDAPTDLRRGEGGAPLGFGLKGPGRQPQAAAAFQPGARQGAASAFNGQDEDPAAVASGPRAPHKRTALEEIMHEQEERKRREGEARQAHASSAAAPAAPQCWLAPGIVVKIMSKQLREAGLYKEKALVRKVVAQPGGAAFLAELEHLKSGAVLQVDQRQLETVIPRQGGAVKVLAGTHRGREGTLVGIDERKFRAMVRLGGRDGEELSLEYEDVCKLA